MLILLCEQNYYMDYVKIISELITDDPNIINEELILEFSKYQPILLIIQKNTGKEPFEILQIAKEADPTDKAKRPFIYLEWILRQWQRSNIILPEDSRRVKDVLMRFNRYKDKVRGAVTSVSAAKAASPEVVQATHGQVERSRQGVDVRGLAQFELNINAYKRISDLEDAVVQMEIALGIRRKKKPKIEDFKVLPGSEIVDESEHYIILKMTTIEALMEYGKGTSWCTRNKTNAASYLEGYGQGRGPQYMIWRKPSTPGGSYEKLIQYSPDFYQFNAVNDAKVKPLDDEMDRLVTPSLDTIDIDPDIVIGYVGLKGDWPELEQIILDRHDVKMAIKYAKMSSQAASQGRAQDKKMRHPELEQMILRDGNTSDMVEYAEYTKTKLSPEIEANIFKDDLLTVRYAIALGVSDPEINNRILNGNNIDAITLLLKNAPTHAREATYLTSALDRLAALIALNGTPEQALSFFTNFNHNLKFGVDDPLASSEGENVVIEKIIQIIGSNKETFKSYLDHFRYYQHGYPMLIPIIDQIMLKYAQEGDVSMVVDYIRSKNQVAQRVTKGAEQDNRWLEIEPYVLKDPVISVEYAVLTKHSLPPQVEDIVKTNPAAATKYSIVVKRKRWPEAESTILNNLGMAIKYAVSFRMEQWPELEEAILRKQDPAAAFKYLLLVKEDSKWPDGEALIMSDPQIAANYKRIILAV